MCVGVLCACVPAAAYAARRNGSPHRKLCDRAASICSALLSSKIVAPASTPTSHVLGARLAPDTSKSTDRKYARYLNFIDMSSSRALNEEEHATNQDSISLKGLHSSSNTIITLQSNVDIELGERSL